jgi:chromosome transmission fidelity protein 4
VKRAPKVNKEAQHQVEQLIHIDPQDAFMSNCKIDQKEDIVGEPVFLHWSLMGTIALRTTASYTSIDVEFSDKNFHRNFCQNDDFKACMATMNYTGMVVASKAEQ